MRPTDRNYLKSHEWCKIENGIATIGISDFAVSHLSDLVRESRSVIGWTQRELAIRAKTSQATVWRIETGRAETVEVRVLERLVVLEHLVVHLPVLALFAGSQHGLGGGLGCLVTWLRRTGHERRHDQHPGLRRRDAG